MFSSNVGSFQSLRPQIFSLPPLLFFFKYGISVYASLYIILFCVISIVCFALQMFHPMLCLPEKVIPSFLDSVHWVLLLIFPTLDAPGHLSPFSLSFPTLETYSNMVLSQQVSFRMQSCCPGKYLLLMIFEDCCCYIPLCSAIILISAFCLDF